MNIRHILLTAALIALPAAASAQETGRGILDLPPGHTVINLSTSERIEVDQDLLVAHLRYEAENADARTLQNEINAVMKKAVDAAKATPAVKVTTQQYYVYPHDPVTPPGQPRLGDRKPARTWRGAQGLEVKSLQADQLLDLIAQMQGMGLSVSHLGYTLSPEKMETTRDGLMEGALEKLKAKAERAARALGKSEASLLEVNVDTGHHYPQPMMARGMMAMDAGASMEMAAPVAAAGQTELNMTVSARALLK